MVRDLDRANETNQPFDSMPILAALVVASPFDAALHDAWGKTIGINSFDGLSAEFVDADLSHYLDGDPAFAGEYLDRYTLRRPKATMPLYHLVGAVDPLTDADIVERPDDDLPVTLGEWIVYDGLTHLKIKLNGDDLDWDVDRTVRVDRVAADVQHRLGRTTWNYSLDFNEKCRDVDYVVEFLRRVESLAPEGFKRIQYLEQPTHRDLSRSTGSMRRAAEIKPVVIDESLIDYASLLQTRELGYSGVALKACKGHGESLALAAAAQKFGMFLCVQDLTCPGASFLHSAELAARIPTVAAIEGNGRQYCPVANQGWADRFPAMFKVRDGVVETGSLTSTGLGHG
jgi:L-alanine-DL-glutamate epimerase-like enolase superfamily enzyme